MIDLGKKSEVSGAIAESKPEKNKVYYPSFYIDGRELDLDDDMAGEVINAKVKLRVNRIGSNVNEDKKKRMDVSFDVMGIEFEKRKPKDDKGKLEEDLTRQLSKEE